MVSRRRFTTGIAWAGLSATPIVGSAARPALHRYSFERISPSVWIAVARPSAVFTGNSTLINLGESLALVDTQVSTLAMRDLLMQRPAPIRDLAMRYVINSHSHLDHAFWNGYFRSRGNASPVIISSSAARHALAQNASPSGFASFLRGKAQELRNSRVAEEREGAAGMMEFDDAMSDHHVPLPDISIDGPITIHGEAITVRVSSVGEGHSPGDVIVHIPEESVVCTGDLLHRFEPLFAGGNPRQWPHTIEAIKMLDAKHLAPGHGRPMVKGVQVDLFKRYIETAIDAVDSQIRHGATEAECVVRCSVPLLKFMRESGLGDEIVSAWRYSFAPWFVPGLKSAIDNNVRQLYQSLGNVPP